MFIGIDLGTSSVKMILVDNEQRTPLLAIEIVCYSIASNKA